MLARRHRPATLARHLPGRTPGGHDGRLLDAGMAGLERRWQRRSFWTAENLMASAVSRRRRHSPRFRRQHAVRHGALPADLQPAGRAVRVVRSRPLHRPGHAAARRAVSRWAGITCRFALLWQDRDAAGVRCCTPRTATVFGHVIFGALIARFPAYLPQATAARRRSGARRPRRNRPAKPLPPESRLELSDAGP